MLQGSGDGRLVMRCLGRDTVEATEWAMSQACREVWLLPGCSNMWKPYLGVIRQNCSQALNILDRFHIVAKVNKALDDVGCAT